MPLVASAAQKNVAAYGRTREIEARQGRLLTAQNARDLPVVRATPRAVPRFAPASHEPFRRPDARMKRRSTVLTAGFIEAPLSSGTACRSRIPGLLVNVLCIETHAHRRIAALFTKEENPQ
ncbi:MAG: hypothetical protein CTY25_08145 [Methylobacterium sp.]|nr:MAG: hypothetical protein CTY25_08145 [Methylobacterium sp.]